LITIVWIGWLGVIVGLPEWVSNLSPFGHEALVPANDLNLASFSVLSAIAVVLVVAGFLGFQRRDIGTA
jgi:ABC-2 type transport system permease protein